MNNGTEWNSEQSNNSLDKLEDICGYHFKNQALLVQAMTHKSFAYEQSVTVRDNNETLEFLGDAFLDLIISEMLICRFPDRNEGDLSKMRAHLVQEKNLSKMAEQIGLGRHLLLGRGEELSGGREKHSILCGAYEALIGAIYTDTGYNAAKTFIHHFFQPMMDEQLLRCIRLDFKSRLQEIMQHRFNAPPVYETLGTEGPDHDKLFTVAVKFNEKILASATAKSKKAAAQAAAQKAIDALVESSP